MPGSARPQAHSHFCPSGYLSASFFTAQGTGCPKGETQPRRHVGCSSEVFVFGGGSGLGRDTCHVAKPVHTDDFWNGALQQSSEDGEQSPRDPEKEMGTEGAPSAEQVSEGSVVVTMTQQTFSCAGARDIGRLVTSRSLPRAWCSRPVFFDGRGTES